MKIRHDAAPGESRQLLLKEYFLNAYLIALLKEVGRGAGHIVEKENDQAARRVVSQN